MHWKMCIALFPRATVCSTTCVRIVVIVDGGSDDEDDGGVTTAISTTMMTTTAVGYHTISFFVH